MSFVKISISEPDEYSVREIVAESEDTIWNTNTAARPHVTYGPSGVTVRLEEPGHTAIVTGQMIDIDSPNKEPKVFVSFAHQTGVI